MSAQSIKNKHQSLYIHQTPQTAWKIIMQSGVHIPCVVNTSLTDLLEKSLNIPAKKLAQIDVFLLNGHPVDDLDKAKAKQGDRLALAAGLPGIAGLSMKKNTVLKGMRPGITHNQENITSAPAEGTIELVLYSLAQPLLAEYFLGRGVLVNSEQLLRYIKLCDLNGTCLLNDQKAMIQDCYKHLPQDTQGNNILLQVDFKDSQI